MTVSEAQQIAARVRSLLPKVKAGTLRIWGEWFGRPHDNYHTIVGCDGDNELVHISFNEGETLTLWNPRGFHIDQETFRIGTAARVRWEWYYYGRPKTPENRYYEDYLKAGDLVTASTNADWTTFKLRPDPRSDAVEIL
jgi:hypothetical protein